METMADIEAKATELLELEPRRHLLQIRVIKLHKKSSGIDDIFSKLMEIFEGTYEKFMIERGNNGLILSFNTDWALPDQEKIPPGKKEENVVFAMESAGLERRQILWKSKDWVKRIEQAEEELAPGEFIDIDTGDGGKNLLACSGKDASLLAKSIDSYIRKSYGIEWGVKTWLETC